MKERPILFSGPMVRAILAGTKTQTRRVISPENSKFESAPKDYWEHADFSRAFVDVGPNLEYLYVPCHIQDEDDESCARCTEMGWPSTTHRLWPKWWPFESWVGDEAAGDVRPPHRLWVKETFWYQPRSFGEVCGIQYQDGDEALIFRADGEAEGIDRWKPSIFMPRVFSRITLEVTEVRVQRLQEISEEDAKTEGIHVLPLQSESDSGAWYESSPGVDQERNPRASFNSLWDSINAKRGFGWDTNPWVWALTFTRVTP